MSERRRLCITKRTCIALLLLLVAGAIVNVAVAWGCALTLRGWSSAKSVYSHEGTSRWRAHIRTYFGVTKVSTVPTNEIWSEDPNIIVETATAGNWRIPAWSRAAKPPSPSEMNDPTGPWRVEFGVGWPVPSGLAIAQANVVPPKKPWHSVSGWMIDSTPGSMRVLPVRPIWPGFAINTVIYAMVLSGGWLLVAGPFALRRRRRIKRGQCPKCAYPVGTNAVCTECGAAVNSSTG